MRWNKLGEKNEEMNRTEEWKIKWNSKIKNINKKENQYIYLTAKDVAHEIIPKPKNFIFKLLTLCYCRVYSTWKLNNLNFLIILLEATEDPRRDSPSKKKTKNSFKKKARVKILAQQVWKML